jgi:YbbR domain-containing protein
MKRHVLKIICLLAAMLIWGQVASSRFIVRDLELPLNVYGLGEGLTLDGNEWPETVKLRARISKWRFLLYRNFGKQLGDVDIDISDVMPGGIWQREITENDVRSHLEEIVITPPQRLILIVDQVDSLLVPVEVASTGVLNEDRILLEPLRCEPDSLWLTGPSRYFTGREVLRTEPVELGRIVKSAELTRKLIPPHPYLDAQVEEARVVVSVALRKSRVYEHITVVPLMDAHQIGVEIFPPVATLTISGPADSIAVLQANRLSATLSLTGLPAGSHTLRPEVHLPAVFTLTDIEPENFMVVVGGDSSSRE